MACAIISIEDPIILRTSSEPSSSRHTSNPFFLRPALTYVYIYIYIYIIYYILYIIYYILYIILYMIYILFPHPATHQTLSSWEGRKGLSGRKGHLYIYIYIYIYITCTYLPYSGSVKALFRFYQGSIKALLRLFLSYAPRAPARTCLIQALLRLC